MEKLSFNSRLSDAQQRFETAQEALDARSQKCKDLKRELKRVQDEGQDKDSGFARL